MTFDVYYLNGELVTFEDASKFCKENEWAKDLLYCSLDDFVVTESGYLMLTDACGNIAYCPKGVFKIVYHINGQDIEQVY